MKLELSMYKILSKLVIFSREKLKMFRKNSSFLLSNSNSPIIMSLFIVSKAGGGDIKVHPEYRGY